MELKDKEFYNLRDLIYEYSRINLTESKRELLKSRTAKRLRALGISSYKDYYKYLLNDTTGEEIINLINVISTNETSFFREWHHFVFMREHIIPEIIKNGRIRIWSAGCSTGEEPYSIAITFHDTVLGLKNKGINVPPFDLKILATDISTKVLEKARAGVYREDRLVGIPNDLLRRHFQVGVGRFEGYYRVKSHLRNIIKFARLNLFDNPYPFKGPFDLIFCRNVMIYFKKEDQVKIIEENFYNLLKPSGYLFLGHAESLAGVRSKFRFVQPSIYIK